MKLILTIALIASICLIAACGNVTPTDEGKASDNKRIEINTAPSQTPVPREAVEFRNPANSAEVLAMDYVNTLWKAYTWPDKSFELLVPYSNAEVLAPYVPNDLSEYALGEVLAFSCSAFEASDKSYSYSRYSPSSWGIGFADEDNAGSLGVVDIRGVTSDSLVAVVFSDEGSEYEGNIYTVYVGIGKLNGEDVVAPYPINMLRTEEKEAKGPVIFSVPHQSIVVSNGTELSPALVDRGGNDIYEVGGIFYNIYNEIEVVLGAKIGTLTGYISANAAVFNGGDPGSGRHGYDSHEIGISYDIATLALTRPEFRALYDELYAITQYFTEQIPKLMDADDHDGFLALTRNPDRFMNNSGELHNNFRGYFIRWQGSLEAIAGSQNEVIEINSIEILQSDTVRITFSAHKTLANGNEFTSDGCQIVLEHTEGGWYLTDLSKHLTHSTLDYWTAAS